MPRHLLLSCSSTKDQRPGLLAASQRYTGVAFAVLRKYIEAGGERPELWIISAKFGLIPGGRPIENYELKMTKPIAVSQCASNTKLVTDIILPFAPKEMGVFLGETYGSSLADLDTLLPNTKVVRFKGPIGKMLQQLKAWLYQIPPGGSKDYPIF